MVHTALALADASTFSRTTPRHVQLEDSRFAVSSLALGRIDADALADLVLGDARGQLVWLRQLNKSHGVSFGAPLIILRLNAAVAAIAVGDVVGDARADVLAGAGDTVFLCTQSGASGAANAFTVERQLVVPHVRGLALADMNSDGRATDVLASSAARLGGAIVLFPAARGAGRLLARLERTPGALVALAGSRVLVVETTGPLVVLDTASGRMRQVDCPASPCTPLHAGDMNSDGQMDVAVMCGPVLRLANAAEPARSARALAALGVSADASPPAARSWRVHRLASLALGVACTSAALGCCVCKPRTRPARGDNDNSARADQGEDGASSDGSGCTPIAFIAIVSVDDTRLADKPSNYVASVLQRVLAAHGGTQLAITVTGASTGAVPLNGYTLCSGFACASAAVAFALDVELQLAKLNPVPGTARLRAPSFGRDLPAVLSCPPSLGPEARGLDVWPAAAPAAVHVTLPLARRSVNWLLHQPPALQRRGLFARCGLCLAAAAARVLCDGAQSGAIVSSAALLAAVRAEFAAVGMEAALAEALVLRRADETEAFVLCSGRDWWCTSVESDVVEGTLHSSDSQASTSLSPGRSRATRRVAPATKYGSPMTTATPPPSIAASGELGQALARNSSSGSRASLSLSLGPVVELTLTKTLSDASLSTTLVPRLSLDHMPASLSLDHALSAAAPAAAVTPANVAPMAEIAEASDGVVCGSVYATAAEDVLGGLDIDGTTQLRVALVNETQLISDLLNQEHMRSASSSDNAPPSEGLMSP